MTEPRDPNGHDDTAETDVPDERDDATLAALAAAVAAHDPVPEALVEAAKAAYTWRTIDAELAALSYDSLLEGAGSVRSAGGGPRALSFEHGPLVLDLEIDEARDGAHLSGQIVPAQDVTLELHGASGVTAVEVDPLGRFRVAPLPDTRFRLAVRLPQGSGPSLVVTEWIAA
jgi:hypothetical protein